MIRRPMRRALLLTLVCVASSGCQSPLLLGGESVLCGDTSDLHFQLARFSNERKGQPVWSSNRFVTLGDAIGVEGASIRDVRIVTVGKSPTFTYGAQARQTGQIGAATDGAVESPDDRRDWTLRVALDSDGARRLEEAVESIAGGYSVVAFVAGDQVISASVDLVVTAGVARIELATTRSVREGRELFQSVLGCAGTSPSEQGSEEGKTAG